jgi:hypothetical protein
LQRQAVNLAFIIMQILKGDNRGLDTEGITPDGKGGFWLCDEYGPFLISNHAALQRQAVNLAFIIMQRAGIRCLRFAVLNADGPIPSKF